MPQRNRSDHPALQAAARLPAYIVLALMIVAVSAGGLLAARGNGTQSTPAGAADAVESESQLPTPVPPSETPLPTPIPLDQSVIVDTAVAFWVEFVPEDLAVEYHEEIVAAGGVPWLSAGGSETASASASPRPRRIPRPTAVPAVTRPAPPVPGPSTVPLPDPPALATPAPLPNATVPAVPLPLPTPTLPPVLPLLP